MEIGEQGVHHLEAVAGVDEKPGGGAAGDDALRLFIPGGFQTAQGGSTYGEYRTPAAFMLPLCA